MTGWAGLLVRSAAVICLACDTEGAGSVDAKLVFRDPEITALAEAAADGDSARVQELVRAGANPNAHGDKGVTLLQWALLNRSTRGITALLAAGANPGAADSSGATVMHYAAMANDPAYLEVLLARRVDPNVRNAITGRTPLMSAMMANREIQFRSLLAAGAKPNLADHFDNTSLHVAAKINAHQRVLDLLEAGADPTARNRQGATFQDFLNMTPSRILSEDGRRKRAAIDAWLREHRVPRKQPEGR